MNVKAMAALVGTLSLGALATGCATAKPATAATTEEKGSERACKTTEAASTTDAASTTEKGAEHSCGANGCGGAAPKKE